MPPATVARAKAVLDKLEAGRAKTGGLAAGLDDLPLFAAAVEAEEAHSDALRDDLIALDIDAMTPRDALDALYRLQALALQNVLYALMGCTLGTLIGILPGLGPLATISMLLPFTYGI